MVTLSEASYLDHPQAVAVKVPVADSLGIPAQDIDSSIVGRSGMIEAFYDDLAYSPETGSYSCARIHQFLFNEVGVICEEKGDEVRVKFPHFYYIDKDHIKHSDFWLHKRSVEKIETMDEAVRETMLEPITAQDSRPTLALVLPWHEEHTAQTYSVGTRFLRHRAADTDTHYGVLLADYMHNTAFIGLVPRSAALVTEPSTICDAKKLFVKILKNLIPTNEKEVIPYVYGGCSTCGSVPEEFYQWKGKRGTVELTNWKRPGGHGVRTGFDCSGLVLRAAQLAGIRYLAKNTTTIGLVYKEVPSDEQLEEGDLILIKGHVMVVSNLEKHLFIDAVGYGTGFGCMRESSLTDFFGEVTTYQELRDWMTTQRPLSKKNRSGNVVDTIPSVRLMRLAHEE